MKPLMFVAALITCNTVAARDLPRWETLEFEQRAFWVTAHASLHLAGVDDEPERWQLTAISSVANNMEQLTLEFDPVSGRLFERERLSRGKNQRLKQYFYAADHVTRVRRVPGGKTGQGSGDWPVSSRRKIALPDSSHAGPLVDSYSLVILASEALNSNGQAVVYNVHTDFNFYRVEVQAGAAESIELQEPLRSGITNLQGPRQAQTVVLKVSPLPGNPEKADFSLLGLSGEISVLYDIETGLPLQLRGQAPRIGTTELNLVNMQLRDLPL